MTASTSVVERAMELARNGVVTDMKALRTRLRLEQYEGIDQHLSRSPSLGRQLLHLLRQAEAHPTSRAATITRSRSDTRVA